MANTSFHTTFSTSHFSLSQAKNCYESGFWSAVSYRFGFNGQEMDNEITGQSGTHTTAMFWEYDSRLGRRWNVDPKPKIGMSGYACFFNNPVMINDILGDSGRVPQGLFDPSKAGTEGYNSEGLNLEDWNTYSQGIYNVSGIKLNTPTATDKNLTISSVDETVGSADARKQYNFLLNNATMHQNSIITNNNPDVLGAENQTAYVFNSDGTIAGTSYNDGLMYIDLADFRRFDALNKSIDGAADSRVLGIGFSYLHENLHNLGVGITGMTKSTLPTFDKETPVINMINTYRAQMGLPLRESHKKFEDTIGTYIPFSGDKKFYINKW